MENRSEVEPFLTYAGNWASPIKPLVERFGLEMKSSPKVAFKIFIQALNDQSSTIRADSALALGWFQCSTEEALRSLESLLLDKNGFLPKAQKALCIDNIRQAEVSGVRYAQFSAALALVALGPISLSILVRALQSADRNLSECAVQALYTIGIPKEELPHVRGHRMWGDIWATPKRDIRVWSSVAPQLVHELLQLVTTGDLSAWCHSIAVRLIGVFPGHARSAIPVLLRDIQHQDERIELACCGALASVCTEKDTDVVQKLVAILRHDGQKRFRSAAGRVLQALMAKSQPMTIDLTRLLPPDEPMNDEVRELLIEVAEKYSQIRPYSHCLPDWLRKETNVARKMGLLRLISRQFDESFQSTMLSLILDEQQDQLVIRNAIQVLANNSCKGNEVLRNLITVLAGNNWNIQSEALSALQSLTGQNYGRDSKKWMDWLAESRP